MKRKGKSKTALIMLFLICVINFSCNTPKEECNFKNSVRAEFYKLSPFRGAKCTNGKDENVVNEILKKLNILSKDILDISYCTYSNNVFFHYVKKYDNCLKIGFLDEKGNVATKKIGNISSLKFNYFNENQDKNIIIYGEFTYVNQHNIYVATFNLNNYSIYFDIGEFSNEKYILWDNLVIKE